MISPSNFEVNVMAFMTSQYTRRTGGLVLTLLFFFACIVSTLLPLLYCGNCAFTQPSQFINVSEHPRIQDEFVVAQYLTTRREAIVKYVRALQAPEGYFHGWLQAPPPFELDGTEPDFSAVEDAYYTLKYIDRVYSLDWTNTKEFLASLVDPATRLLKLSKSSDVSLCTCLAAVTFYAELGLDHLIDMNANAEYVSRLQQEDGGFFYEQGSIQSELIGTCDALRCLQIQGRLDLVDLQRARAFLELCYNESEGCFSNVPGGYPNFLITPAGIIAADILGVLDEPMRNKIAEYLMIYWKPAKGCDNTEDLRITYLIAWSLFLLNRKEMIDSAKMAMWLLDLHKHMNGAFVGYPEAELSQERLVCAKEVTELLYLYNETYRLDENFSVVSDPVWTIPQWWIDYVNSVWGTTSSQSSSPCIVFFLPDLSVIITSLPIVGLAVIISTPAIWVVHKRRVEKARRRQLQQERKNLGRGA